MSSLLFGIHILDVQKRWHVQKSPNYRAFLLFKSRKFSEKNEGWHWGILAVWQELNPHISNFGVAQMAKYRQIPILWAENSKQSFRLGFSAFHELWKHRIRAFIFCDEQISRKTCERFVSRFQRDWGQVGKVHHGEQQKPLWAICEPVGRYIDKADHTCCLWIKSATGGM